MRVLDDVQNMLCRELDEIQHKELSSNNLEVIDKAVDILKDISTINAMEQGGYSNEYSGRFPMYAYDGNSYGNSYEYSNARRRDSMGRYSREGVMEHLQKAMDEAKDDRQRDEIRRLMDSVKR